jgi:hypothetical protein
VIDRSGSIASSGLGNPFSQATSISIVTMRISSLSYSTVLG